MIAARRALAAAALTFLGACSSRDGPNPAVVGDSPTTSTALPTSTVIVQPTLPRPDLGRPPIAEPGPAVGLKVANGRPFLPAIEFRSGIDVPTELVFVIVAGSDARPREDLRRTRADSLHLLAVNPKSRQGTVVGFPRDAYVEYPGGGRGKINDALARGGPRFLAETVRKLTGLPVHYYALTGFVGFARMVDELGGVDVHVDRRMNDRVSGARFEAGWHHFNGADALAYTRNRNDVQYGDFTRSENQGNLILATLGKMRSEVANDDALLTWVGLIRRNVDLDVPIEELPKLAALARRLDPTRIANVVLPGRVGYAGRASVVYLTQDAPRLFADLRDDAVIGQAEPPPPTTTTSTSTSTTSSTTTSTTSTTVGVPG